MRLTVLHEFTVRRRRRRRRRRILHPYSRPHVGLLDGMFNINIILIAAVRVLQDSPTGHQHHGDQHYGQPSLQRKAVQSISIHSNVITWQAATVPVPTQLAYRTLQVGASNTSTHTSTSSTSGKSCTTQTSQATTTQAGDQLGEPTAQQAGRMSTHLQAAFPHKATKSST